MTDGSDSEDSFLRAVADVPVGAAPRNLEGLVLGKYRIGKRLGAGGMGVVHQAQDTDLRREVALKVLPAELVGDAERRQRFLREARLAAALPHPNIAVVHEVGERDGHVYLVMELVEGKTLRARMNEGPLVPAEAARIASAIAAGLTKAHEAGIVHRDLKPENVMLTATGTVKILDFGIAKLRDPGVVSGESATVSALTTAEGRLLGTPAYMSPEQAKGRSVDEKSDVFSLGVVLYEMVTGKRPFSGTTPMETLIAIDRDAPVVPSKLAPISDSLERAVLWCLEKRPEKRPTIQQLAVALAGLEHADLGRRRASRWALVLIATTALSMGLVGLTVARQEREPPVVSAEPLSSPSAPPPASSTPAMVPVVADPSASRDAGIRRLPAPSHAPAAPDAAAKAPEDLFHGLAVDAPF